MISAIDRQITFFIFSTFPHLPIFDSVFRTLSLEGATAVIWALIVALVFVWEFYVRNNKFVFLAQLGKLCFALAFTIAISAGAVHYVLKPVFQRTRPYIQYNVSAPYCPNDYSFPSGHATVAFAGVYILSKFDHDRRRKVIYAIIAISVSFSRIYLLCHYVGDIAAGAIFGLAVAFVGYEGVHLLYQVYHKHHDMNRTVHPRA